MAKRKSKPAEKAIKARRRTDAERDEDVSDDQARSVKWWKCDEGTMAAAALWTWVDRLRPALVAANYMDLIYEAIYEGRPLTNVGAANGLEMLRTRASSPARFNITRSMVDTATARLTKRRPMPAISADDAGWTEKRFARSTSRILRRKMGSSTVERMSPEVIRDMIIRGDGCAKVVRCGGDVEVERIPIYEVVYDPGETYYGPPRTLAHHRPLPREVLLAEFPDHEEAINAAATFNRADQWTQYTYGNISLTDRIEVAESWHLPSGADTDDGQHIIAIRGCTLLRECWNRSTFPIKRCRWSPPTRGFRGHGLVEDLAGIQAKIDDILRDAQEALYFGSMLKVFQPRQAGVAKNHLRARHPVVIEYDGAPPTYVAPNPVSEQAIRILMLLLDKAYEIAGISQMSASSKSTLGSNASGKALDTMEDIQSDRFAHVESDYMQFRVDLGRGICDEAKAMYEEAHGDDAREFGESPEPIAVADLAPWIREHDWSKVDIEGGDYHLIIEPINFLPDSRAGKLSFVAEMSKAGLIPDPTMTADLFDEPDVARMNRTTLGPKHNIDRVLEGLADPAVPTMDLAPDETWNLALAVLMAKGERNEAQADGADGEILERYDWFLQECARLLKIASTGEAASLQGAQAANQVAQANAAGALPTDGMPMPAQGGAPADMAMMGAPPGEMMQ